MEAKITYFETPGADNTETTLRLAAERARERKINTIVLASTTGNSARQAAEIFAGTGIKLVVVPQQYGLGETQRFPAELITELEKKGHRVYFGTMLFHTDSLYGDRGPTVIATALRALSQGVKVCTEITLMATNGGCVPIGEKVIAIGGTSHGVDTAIVAKTAPSNWFHEFHIQEIICKPLETRTQPMMAEGAQTRPAEPPWTPTFCSDVF